MILQANSISCGFAGSTLFQDLSFSVNSGQTLVVTGPSGSGKSTLLRCVAWLEPLMGGTLTLNDKTPGVWGVCAWRSAVCYVPQAPPPLHGTAANFLAHVEQLSAQRGRETSPARVLSQQWGIDDKLWQRPFAELSGGERQRLMLALAVSRKPAVLLLDEPTSAVDERRVEQIEQSLSGITKLWVTHDETQAERVADQRLSL
jgi:ABC-type iron transport system FetAB ATPase subunit